MKRGFKFLAILAFILVGVISLTGCNKAKKTIVGKWAHDSYVYTFNKDKTCSYDAAGTKMECTYEIDGENLSILYKGNTAPFKTTYSIDGDKLNVKDSFGSDTIYTRKK